MKEQFELKEVTWQNNHCFHSSQGVFKWGQPTGQANRVVCDHNSDTFQMTVSLPKITHTVTDDGS